MLTVQEIENHIKEKIVEKQGKLKLRRELTQGINDNRIVESLSETVFCSECNTNLLETEYLYGR